MDVPNTREVTLPVGLLADLADALDEAGHPHLGRDAIQAAGAAYGRRLAQRLAGGGPSIDGGDGASDFWARLDRHLDRRGWGRMRHEAGHPGIGLLVGEDWAESRSGVAGGGCVFTVGVLEGLLSELAHGPVAVYEAECRGEGGRRCAFVFGSAAAVAMVRRGADEEPDLDRLLASLTLRREP